MKWSYFPDVVCIQAQEEDCSDRLLELDLEGNSTFWNLGHWYSVLPLFTERRWWVFENADESHLHRVMWAKVFHSSLSAAYTHTRAHTHTHTHIHIYTRTHTHTHTHARTYTHTHARTLAYTRTHARTLAHTRTHARTRAHTHTSKHTQRTVYVQAEVADILVCLVFVLETAVKWIHNQPVGISCWMPNGHKMRSHVRQNRNSPTPTSILSSSFKCPRSIKNAPKWVKSCMKPELAQLSHIQCLYRYLHNGMCINCTAEVRTIKKQNLARTEAKVWMK